jgi:hypothetical protein
VTDVGGGKSTALPWHGKQSNDGNKAETPSNDLTFQEYYIILYLHNMKKMLHLEFFSKNAKQMHNSFKVRVTGT